jgi:hypothetical protein
LGRLIAAGATEGFYLAGGTAVAVHRAHRRSVDLDLFSLSPEVDLGALLPRLGRAIGDLRVIGLTDATLRVVVDGVPVDLVRYPYALLGPTTAGPLGFAVAGLRDLGAMKLAAIARRGLRRDFWDLYEIIRAGLSLEAIASAYRERYGATASDLYHVLRALTYFDDAEAEAVRPEGLTPAKWSRIRAYFEAEAPGLLG